MSLVKKDVIWDKVLALLTDRKKEFLTTYFECNRNIPEVSKKLGMYPQAAYKYIREDKLIQLAIEIHDIGDELLKPIEMPTFESVLSETVELHNMDKEELQKLKNSNEEDSKYRSDKVMERMEKRNKFIMDIKNKFGEVIDEEAFKLRNLPSNKLKDFIMELFKDIEKDINSKKWYEDSVKKQELEDWKKLKENIA